MRTGKSITDWIHNSLPCKPITSENIYKDIINPIIEKIPNYTKKEFQENTGNIGKKGICIANAGDGKSLAFWYWAAENASNGAYGYVIITEPQRNLTTAQFQDYLLHVPKSEVGLIHSSAERDLLDMYPNSAKEGNQEKQEKEAKLFALQDWNKRYIASTIDTVSGYSAFNYASICRLPIIVNAMIGKDEVHAYDSHMFASEERIEKMCNGTTLYMSASLTEGRKNRLINCGFKPIELSPDYQNYSKLPRYKITKFNYNINNILNIIQEGIENGLYKILWYTNTVRRCQENADVLLNRLKDKVEVVCYHSYFRRMDSFDIYENLLKKYKIGSKPHVPIVTVLTQIGEMSLNLDADIIITEIGPITAIIQRLGRGCRVQNPGNRRCYVYYYEPNSKNKNLPYLYEDYEEGNKFLHEMEKLKERSRYDLVEYLENLDKKEIKDSWVSLWDSGFFMIKSNNDNYREDNQYTVNTVLENDIKEYETLLTEKNPHAIDLILRAPRNEVKETDITDLRKRNWCYVGHKNCYTSKLGYKAK